MENYIDPTATIGQGTTIGRFSIIEKNVQIGTDCTIGNLVVIHQGTRIGNGVRIDDNTVIGKQPMRAKRSIFKDEKSLPPTEIGDSCLIGAQAVIYAGAIIATGVLIADTAAIRENVTIGEYTIVGRGVTVENLTKIGKKCKLETGCYITAYSEIEDYCFIAPKVTTTNDNFLGRTQERFKHFKGVTVRKGGRIGGGAVILPGIEIGEDAVVGAGSVVTRNVPPRQIVVGVPAKFFRPTPEEQLLENQGWD
ncbi:MAG: DapH/DapD/GlmU-related protein [candidate division KSB1 bacterium]|nr:DapH/DapD/GlmU-related protein [candidate division KSB1 bacterium]